MEALGSVSSIITVAQVAGAVAKLCGGYILDVKDARQDIERLQKQTAALRDVVDRLSEMSDPKKSKSVSLSTHVMDSINRCLEDLQELHDRLQPKTKHKAMSKVGWRALKWPLSKSDVNEEMQRLEGYLAIFNTALQFGHIAITQGLENKFDQNRDEQLLRTISHVGDAAFNSYENQRHRRCLQDTRVELLREIMDWATSTSSQYIFWLKGRAGTGKSTIALTIAESLDQHRTPLASFFFRRGGGDLARSRKVVSTIAFQLAHQSSLLGGFICDTIQNDPNLGKSASLSEQYHKLLLHPLQRVQKSGAGSLLFLVILDALDECDDVNDIRLLLRLFGSTQNLSGLGLRILVTSRPEVPIRLGFQDMKHIAYYELALHDVPRAIVDRDIKMFVTHELAQIKADRGLPDSWPQPDQIETITILADRLFIYAATVCRFVDGPRQVNVSARLEQVCQGKRVKHKSTEALDGMYLMILQSSMSGDFSVDEEQEVAARLRQVVGSLVLLFDSLSAEELGKLLFPGTSTGGALVRNTLDSLHAILDVPDDRKKPVKMQHLSFRDFLVDSDRCPDPRFNVNQQDGHRQLTSRCLDLMSNAFRQNICSLSGLGTLISEVSDTTLDQCVPPALRYACRHWVDHAELGGLEDDSCVHRFLSKYVSCWMEVVSLIGKLPEAMGIMRKLERLVEKSPQLHSMVRDTLRFMYSFSHILSRAPLQLYGAGLVFSPSDSIFRRSFKSQSYKELDVRTQLRDQWNQCLYTLEGHSSSVNTVVFSPDGSRVASGSSDYTVRVWDVQTGECQHTLEGHSSLVESVVFSPDGSRVASGSYDNTVRVWDVQTGECQHTLKGYSSSVYSVVFSPDGSRVASGSSDNTVRVWDVQTGECQHTLKGHSSSVNTVVFSPDGSRVASGSSDNTVRVWDVQTSKCQHTLEGHSSSVNTVVFSPNGSHVASGSYDNTVRVWDIQTGECQHILKGHSSSVYSVVFSPDGSHVASGSDDNTVRVWDVQTGECQHTLKGHSSLVDIVVFSPNGSRVASGSDDNTVRVWDIQTGECQHTLEGHSSSVNTVVFSPNGSRVASGSSDNTVRVWDVQTGEYQHAIEGHSSSVNTIVFSPNGSCVASGSSDETVRVWDIQTGKCRRTLKGHSSPVNTVVFSPDGSRVASGSFDNTVRVWDMQTSKCQHALKGHSSLVDIVVFSPNGSRVASGSYDNMVRVWDVQTGECQHTLKGHSSSVYSVVFSPDGSRVASGSYDNMVRVWDVQTGECQHTLEGHSSSVNTVVFSPDGSRVASGSSDNTVRVWDVQTSKCQYTLEGHSSSVYSVVFSPDGSRVASGSSDKTVRVWDISSATVLLCYDTYTNDAHIEFGNNRSNILINGQLVPIPPLMPPSPAMGQLSNSNSASGGKLGVSGDWVTWASKRILWLPPEYRPGLWASYAETIVIGSGSGRVTFIRRTDESSSERRSCNLEIP